MKFITLQVDADGSAVSIAPENIETIFESTRFDRPTTVIACVSGVSYRVVERRKQILQMIKHADGISQIERTPFEATPEAAKRPLGAEDKKRILEVLEYGDDHIPPPEPLSLSDPIEGVGTARLVVICGCGVILETPAEYREHSCGCETCGNARTRLHRDETGLFCEKCS